MTLKTTAILADACSFIDRNCAAAGLLGYRYRGRFGWIMIGARDRADALREAGRSTDGVIDPLLLEVWNGERYVMEVK